MASSRGGGFEDAAAGSLVGLAILAVVAISVFLVWLAVRTVHTIISAFRINPRSRLLRALLAAAVAFVLLALLTGLQLFGALAWLSFFALAVIARSVVLSHRATFDEPQGARQFMDDVLTDWWPEAA